MKSQDKTLDVAALLRARNSFIWVVTSEETRTEGNLFEAAALAGYVACTWDIAAGFRTIGGKKLNTYGNAERDPDAALTYIEERTGGTESNPDRNVFILRDFPAWITGPNGAATLRQLKNLIIPTGLASRPSYQAQAIIVISPSKDVPAEIANMTKVIEWPLPDREEIALLLDATMEPYMDDARIEQPSNGSREAAIDAAVGLSGEEAQSTFAFSLVQHKRIDPATIASEKKRAVAKGGILEWFEPLPGGMDSVGGLDNLKNWLLSRACAYTLAARQYGLPAPKGCLLVGVPGCGKSLLAKAIGTAWGVPIIRLDLGALKSKYVGESETNLRQALAQIEAIGRCVVWLDEIEKALDGATSGSADGGVSADALGAILTWMQDRQGEAFVIATANNAEKLPPELLRKGRFDEVWWVDLPNYDERASIIKAALASHGRKDSTINPAAIAGATEDFTGAEIAALVPDAMFAAFNDGGREVTTDDLLDAAKTVVPLAVTASEKINALRSNWVGRARNATSAVRADVTSKGRATRQLDLV